MPAVRGGQTSLPLRDLAPRVWQPLPAFAKVRHLLPRPAQPEVEDLAWQRDDVAGSLDLPAVGTSFDGMGQGFVGPNGLFNIQFDPPDTNIAVGRHQIVEMVNTAVAVYDKQLMRWTAGPIDLHDVWTNDFPDCRLDDGDPIVLYDRLADRWILSQLGGFNFGSECVAVSQTSDATGSYYLYEFKPAASTDYPKLSVWPDAYYLTTNEFTNNERYLGAGVCALDRKSMLRGAAAISICFNTSTDFDTVLTAGIEGSLLPPPGSPNYAFALDNNTHAGLAEWLFHVDFAHPDNSSFTGPINVPVAGFNPVCRFTFDCVPQKGTLQRIDALGNLLMFHLAYRNFGSYESLTAVHTVAVTDHGTRRTGERWYEIRNPGASPLVYQQGTWAPSAQWRFMASLDQDKQGNIAMGYSVSSSTEVPGIRYSGRRVTDPLNLLEREIAVTAGAGFHNDDRWGDYSSMVIDPFDDCTFWYANEYQTQNGALTWHTRIASIRFPSCH
ncbi:MAG: hypothetical protein H0X25_09710 [Acidobacteriales bacterium]|nr:hypothetical protein [Terriglobales bacterium]